MTEKDPLGRSAHEAGSKLDDGKTQWIRYVLAYFPRAVAAVAGVSAYGAKKYTEMGWATVPDGYTRYTEAMGRHIASSVQGEQLDVSGLDHDAQVAWNALARLEIKLKEQENATESKSVIPSGPFDTTFVGVSGRQSDGSVHNKR